MRLIHHIVEDLQAPEEEAVTPMGAALIALLGGERGSPAELATRFAEAGLGPVMDSWLGEGPRLSVDPHDLRRVLGEERVEDLATLAGLASGDFLVHLARLLPAAVHRMTAEREPEPTTTPVGLRKARGISHAA
jgi:uncharacterized protein YidB (DUF937 family)